MRFTHTRSGEAVSTGQVGNDRTRGSALRSRVRRFESCRGHLELGAQGPVTSGNAEAGVFAYVQEDAARSRSMSGSMDEAWTGS